ncbi:MAG: N-acetyltransferase family protein [Pseudobdellovibrionaceae bacterium]
MATLSSTTFESASNGSDAPQWFVIPTTAEDAAELERIHRLSRYEADRKILPAYAEATLKSGYFAKYWEDALSRKDRFFLKAVDPAGTIWGFVAMGLPSSEPHYEHLNDSCEKMAELHQIYVAPECQHRSMGRLLYEAGARRLAEEGYTDMVINVLSENHNGKAFYQKMGAWQATSHLEMIDRGGVVFPVPVDLYMHSALQPRFSPSLEAKGQQRNLG